MEFSQNNDKMIYVQLAEWLEDEILAGTFPEGSRIPSAADISANFKINHITALKGVGLLTDGGIIYKSRGVGMFVAEGAVKKLQERRRGEFCERFLKTAVSEAKKLGIGIDEICGMIREVYGNE